MKKALSVFLAALLVFCAFVFALPAAAEGAFAEYAVGDVIEYGAYPQTEVTDPELTAVLASYLYEWKSYNYYPGGGNVYTGEVPRTDFMRYQDVVYEGEKYRAVTLDAYRPNSAVNDGADHVQELSGYTAGNVYWFRYEPIRWRVLDPAAGLVICDTVIDSQAYIDLRIETAYDVQFDENGAMTSITTGPIRTYADSDIRAWLDDTFLLTAFGDAQKENLEVCVLENDYWTSIPSAVGTAAYMHKRDDPATQNQIFLPAWDDITNTAYGFLSNSRTADPGRVREGTDYAKCQGLLESDGSAAWWLRTSADYNNQHSNVGACAVSADGTAGSWSVSTYPYFGVCPMMRMAEIRSEAFGRPLFAAGDVILYGTYPQTKVTDETLTAALTALAADAAWQSYGYYQGTAWYAADMHPDDYMRYVDLVYNGSKYRGVVFDTCRPAETGRPSQTGSVNGYACGTVYWFAYEPLQWRILDPETGLVFSEKIIDSQAFQNYLLTEVVPEDYRWYDQDFGWGDPEKTFHASNYARSSIRAWLNADFTYTAFSQTEQANMETPTLGNPCYHTALSETGFEAFDAPDTADRVFLLSYTDIVNPAYGFSADPGTEDAARAKTATDYALCQGYRTTWLSRTTGNYYVSSRVTTVNTSGLATYENTADFTDTGVCPAMALSVLTSEPAVIELPTSEEHRYISQTVKPEALKAEADCDSPAEYYYSCADCGAVEQNDAHTFFVGNALGHAWNDGVVTTEPTCIAEGEKTFTCDNCGETYTEPVGVDPDAHRNTEDVPETASTCYAPGYTAGVYCNDCKQYISGHAPKQLNAHAWDEGTVTLKPTCKTTGTVLYRCTVKSCGATKEETLGIDPDAHVYKVTVVEPTCTSGSYTSYACTLCPYRYTTDKTDPLGHTYAIRVTPATCTSGGYTTYTCTRCRDSYTKDPTPALGHADNDGDGYCDHGCGTKLSDPGGGSEKCPFCGNVHTGPFGGIISFFHRIAYFFKHLFGG